MHTHVCIRTDSDSLAAIVLYRDLPVSSGYLDSITVNVIRRLSASALVHPTENRASPSNVRCTHLIIIRIKATLSRAYAAYGDVQDDRVIAIDEFSSAYIYCRGTYDFRDSPSSLTSLSF